MEWCFDAVTQNSAQILGLEGYGVSKGCKADFVVLQANDKIEAVRLRAHRIAVVRKGKVVSKAGEVTAKLNLNGRPSVVNEARLSEINH